MRISDWSSDVCSSDLADIVEDVELVVARCRILDDEAFEEGAQRRQVAVDPEVEIDVLELELRGVKRHQLVGSVGEKPDPILRPLLVHRVSPWLILCPAAPRWRRALRPSQKCPSPAKLVGDGRTGEFRS